MITNFPVGCGTQQVAVHVRDITNNIDLYNKNADVLNVFPASISKLMTILLCYEYKSANLTDTVTITSADVSLPGGFTTAGLMSGDIVTWRDLLYAAILPSGCDACQAIARVIGTELYTGTGLTGMPKFIERMNQRAEELMIDATFENPYGNSKTFGPDTVRNALSARAVSMLCQLAYFNTPMRAIGGAATYTTSIAGPNARSKTWNNVFHLFNGPHFAPAGLKDSRLIAGKTGIWLNTNQFNGTVLMTAPTGEEIVITVFGSCSDYGLILDIRGIMNMLLRDYPQYAPTPANDPYFSNVKVLIGFESDPPIDEVGNHSLVLSGVTQVIGGGLVKDSDDAGRLKDPTGLVKVVNSSDLFIGTNDFTTEMWFTGPWYGTGGNVDTNEFVPIIKAVGGTQREYCFNIYGNTFHVFVSSDNNNWTSIGGSPGLSTQEMATLFNGAPRHAAIVKRGTNVWLYIDGDRIASATVTSIPNIGSAIQFGLNTPGDYDEIRVTIGAARYTTAMETILATRFPRS